jgi:class 3 adenylate cyclase
VRAAEAALAIRDVITSLRPPTAGGKEVTISCQIGMARGSVFAAEIGEPRGRREFNILSDTVNTAARLMGRALGNRILMNEAVQEDIKNLFACETLGSMPLKGKTERIPIYGLRGPLEMEDVKDPQAEGAAQA